MVTLIAYLEGTILLQRKDRVIVKAGPVGYEVYVLNPASYTPGQEVQFFCYQQFREDGQTLYGFESEEQYQLFTLLITVKGLGCKSVLNALQYIDVQTMIKAIENADATTLKKLPGIGSKTAGQIILDLKGKVVFTPQKEDKKKAPQNPVWSEVVDALQSLGYKEAEINTLQIEPDVLAGAKVDELLRVCLKQLAKGKLF